VGRGREWRVLVEICCSGVKFSAGRGGFFKSFFLQWEVSSGEKINSGQFRIHAIVVSVTYQSLNLNLLTSPHDSSSGTAK